MTNGASPGSMADQPPTTLIDFCAPLIPFPQQNQHQVASWRPGLRLGETLFIANFVMLLSVLRRFVASFPT